MACESGDVGCRPREAVKNRISLTQVSILAFAVNKRDGVRELISRS